MVQLYDAKEPYYQDYKKAYEYYKQRTTGLEVEYKLVFLTVPDPTQAVWSEQLDLIEWQGQPKLQNLRRDEYNSVIETAENGVEFIASYSTQSYAIIESRINICRTTFIVILLGLASIYFTKDAQELVLDPLERMIEKIKAIAKNPMVATTEEVNEAGIMSFSAASEDKNKVGKKEGVQHETAVLERAIVKIGHLLVLGFGEAGGNIIGQNMTNGGELNPMMPGVKTYAIFGFCILEDFIETTEVLQTEIMQYVN